MPPSGFSKKAINGLLEFIKANYEAISKIEGNDEREQLLKGLKALEKHKTSITTRSTPFPISNQGITGLHTFITSCIEDLHEEINKGSDKYGREVRKDWAISKEIAEIGNYLETFKI